MSIAPARSRLAARILAGIMLVTAAVLFVFLVLPDVVDRDGLLGIFGVPLAFLVGVVSFFSPCILPLLPGYLSFVSGLTSEQLESGVARKRVVTGSALFVLGFATVFTVLGASASLLGSYFLDHLSVINRVAGVIVIVMGVAFIVPSAIGIFERERRPFMARVKPGLGGAFPLGLAFAVGWTPCIGPGLGVILTLGAREGSAARGGILLFAFSLGFGMWFVLGGLATSKALSVTRWMRERARAIQLTGGVFMLAIGVLLVTDRWNSLLSPLRRWISNFTPPV